jgi:hypothetical protein
MITEAAKAAKVSRGHESVAAAPWCKFATDKRKINVGCPRYMFAKLPTPLRYLKKLPHGWEFATASDFADWINMFQLYTRTDVGQMREPSVYVPWSPCSTTRYTIAAGGENHHGARIYLLATLDAPQGQAQRFKIFQGGDDAEATYVHESDDPPVSISDPIVFTVGANGIATVRFCVAALEHAERDEAMELGDALRAIVVAAKKSLREGATALHATLRDVEDEVLLDDRWGERLGGKLKEAELIGYPFVIVLGRAWEQSGGTIVELQQRAAGRSIPSREVSVDELTALLGKQPII